jgi:6-phosphofructokinase 1
MMQKRIGVITGGGDCPGLNAVIRAVTKAAYRRGWETIGILGGYDGLLEPCSSRTLDHREMGGLLQRGGTILGTANRGKLADAIGQLRRVPLDGGFVRSARALGICLGD